MDHNAMLIYLNANPDHRLNDNLHWGDFFSCLIWHSDVKSEFQIVGQAGYHRNKGYLVY